MKTIPSAQPLLAHERPRQRSISESLNAIKTRMEEKKRKKNWQPPKDPNDFYRRNGLPSDAEASQKEAARRYDPHGND